MILNIALHIYFAFSLIILGYGLNDIQDSYRKETTSKGKIIICLKVVVILLTAGIVGLYLLLLKDIVDKFSNRYQLRFFQISIAILLGILFYKTIR